MKRKRYHEEKEDLLVDEGEVKRVGGIIKKKKAGAFDTGVFLQDTDNGAWAQLCIDTCTYAQRVCECHPS